MAWNVVIAGAGFAGSEVARRLARDLPPHSARITLVNDVNFMLYTPLLPGAAGGTLEPRHVVVPLREQLDASIELLLGRITGADPDRSVLCVSTLEGQARELAYDQLVVAVGSVSKTLPIPGLAEHAVGFKTLAEGIALRNHVIQTLEMAESTEDPEQRRALLTYVFVGAGYAGVEGLAELQDLAADMLDSYPRCRMDGMRWVLVEARDQIMGEIPASLAEHASEDLRGRGIEIRTSTELAEVGRDSVTLKGGESIPTRTVAWTAGVKPHPVVARLGLATASSGRIDVDEYMQSSSHPNVWAIGDAAAVPNPAKPGEPCPPTAQHAIRQARKLAGNVGEALGAGGRRRKFKYKTLGYFVDLGRHQAVALTMGIRWRGFPAWFLARTYHLALMPGAGRKLRLVTDWTVGLMFGRDGAELGQLGHPEQLGDGGGLSEQSQGGTGDGNGPPDEGDGRPTDAPVVDATTT